MDNIEKQSHNYIWEEVKNNIKIVIPGQSFSTWFEPIKSVGINGEILTIEVPSQFYYEWIDNHYRKLILDNLKKITDREIQVRYSIVVGEQLTDKDKTNYSDNKFIEKTRYDRNSKLNKRYNFDNFVEGTNNQFAKAAAMSVAESPGQTSFNPLVIYGGVGLGKTHLLQAIGNYVINKHKGKKANYTTSEKFTLDFIYAIQNNKTAEFSSMYRKTDVLLIDDIQFLQKKEQTQEQFFHTFNELYQQGKQIILTTDRHPSELSGLKDRLISRFQSGLIVDIQPPNLETRIAILQKKAEEDGLEIPYEITEFIALNIHENIREMEGALIKILAHSSLSHKDIDIDLAKKALKETLGSSNSQNVTIDDIIKKVSTITNFPEAKLIGKGRKMEIALTRQIAMYLSREIVNTSLVNIGMHFGGRDHTTVIHACRTVKSKMKTDKAFSRKVDNIRNQIIV